MTITLSNPLADLKRRPEYGDWLVPTLQDLLPEPAFVAVREQGDMWAGALATGLVHDRDIVRALSLRFRLGIATVDTIPADAALLLPEVLARRFQVVPLGVVGTKLQLATASPADLDAEQMVAFATGRRVELLVASPTDVARALDLVYHTTAVLPDASEVTPSELDTESGTPDLGDSRSAAAPIVKLVDQIVAEGIRERASDIHVERREGAVHVVFRVDGVLKPAMKLPLNVGSPVVSRIKILARLDIADRMRPQDGRARILIDGARVDLRVSTLPAAAGEKVVLRVMDARAVPLSLDELGIVPADLERIRALCDLREGMVLVTGPTGSGKTTTLYSMLREIRARGVNIVTVEDPVEVRIPGIVQVQVNEKSGLTFAAALRSILRQDPDVVLVGEIRDAETARIAVQASLTGHLVLATLHTIDAVSAVARLRDIGVEGYKIGAALKGVVAQRLARRRCPRCAPSSRVGAGALELMDASMTLLPECAECGGAGYFGRLALTEVLTVDRGIERLITDGASALELGREASRCGMSTLAASGVFHVQSGATDFDEIRRTVDVRSVLPPGASGAWEHGTVLREWPGAEIVAGTALPTVEHAVSSAIPPQGRSLVSSQLEAGVVDVVVYRTGGEGGAGEVLALRRAEGVRCTGAWELVHGSIEPGERPEQAAVREVLEETGLGVDRLYNLTCHAFYLQKTSTVQVAITFVAFVTEGEVRLSEEHDRAEWVSVASGAGRFFWPRTRQLIREASELYRTGDGREGEGVLRVL